MRKVNTLLKELLEIFKDPVIRIDSVDQDKFLNDIFGEKMSSKAASRVFSNDRADGARLRLRKMCQGAEINEKISKAIYDSWRCSKYDLLYALTGLVKKTRFLTQADRNKIQEITSPKSIIKELLYIGLGKQQLVFFPHQEELRVFVGRTEEIEKIENILFEKNICYLYGITGYGKTSLARYIGANFEYDDYIEVQYADELKESLMKCNNFPENMTFDDRCKQLQELDETILLILDNVNENYKTEKDNFSKFIEELPCRKIIILNSKPQGLSDFSYEVKAPSEKELINIFKNNISVEKVSEAERREIINIVQRNTFLVILCAKILSEGMITAKALIQELKCCLFHISDETKIQMKFYEEIKTYNTIVKKLYDMYDLNDAEKRYLYAIWIFRKNGIDKSIFLHLINANDANVLNLLIKKGWIGRDCFDEIIIHKIVADCINNERENDKERVKEIQELLFYQVTEKVNSFDHSKILLANKWIQAFSEIVLENDFQNDNYANLIIDIGKLWLNNFSLYDMLEKLLKKLKECNENFRVNFYIRYFQNHLMFLEGKEFIAKKMQEGDIRDLIYRLPPPAELNDWIDYFDCIASGFEFIRGIYLYQIKKYSFGNALYRDMIKSDEYERKKIDKLLSERDDILNVTRVHMYYMRLSLYYLRTFPERQDLNHWIAWASQFAEQFPDVSIEVHRGKAIQALERENKELAKQEIQSAYEKCLELDNPLYQLECLEHKIAVYRMCNTDGVQLENDINNLYELLELVDGWSDQPYYFKDLKNHIQNNYPRSNVPDSQ